MSDTEVISPVDAPAAPAIPLGGDTTASKGLPENDIPDPTGAAGKVDYAGFDKAADAELNKILGADPEPTKYPWEETPESKDVVQAGTEGKPESPAKGDEPGTPEPEKAPEKAAVPDREMREKIVRAKQALGRTGLYDDAEMDAMPVDRLLAKGDKARRDQEAYDRQKRDTEKWKTRARAQGAEAGEVPGDPPGRSGEGDSAAEVGDAGRPWRSIDQMVEDGLIDKSVADEIQSRHRSTEEKVGMALGAVSETRLAAATDLLVGEFPALKNERDKAEWLAYMADVDRDGSILLGQHGEFMKFAKRAAWAVLGEGIGRSTRESLLRDNAKAVANAPLKPGGSAGQRKLTPEQLEDLALRAATESRSPDEFYQVMDKLKQS